MTIRNQHAAQERRTARNLSARPAFARHLALGLSVFAVSPLAFALSDSLTPETAFVNSMFLDYATETIGGEAYDVWSDSDGSLQRRALFVPNSSSTIITAPGNDRFLGGVLHEDTTASYVYEGNVKFLFEEPDTATKPNSFYTSAIEQSGSREVTFTGNVIIEQLHESRAQSKKWAPRAAAVNIDVSTSSKSSADWLARFEKNLDISLRRPDEGYDTVGPAAYNPDSVGIRINSNLPSIRHLNAEFLGDTSIIVEAPKAILDASDKVRTSSVTGIYASGNVTLTAGEAGAGRKLSIELDGMDRDEARSANTTTALSGIELFNNTFQTANTNVLNLNAVFHAETDVLVKGSAGGDWGLLSTGSSIGATTARWTAPATFTVDVASSAEGREAGGLRLIGTQTVTFEDDLTIRLKNADPEGPTYGILMEVGSTGSKPGGTDPEFKAEQVRILLDEGNASTRITGISSLNSATIDGLEATSSRARTASRAKVRSTSKARPSRSRTTTWATITACS